MRDLDAVREIILKIPHRQENWIAVTAAISTLLSCGFCGITRRNSGPMKREDWLSATSFRSYTSRSVVAHRREREVTDKGSAVSRFFTTVLR